MAYSIRQEFTLPALTTHMHGYERWYLVAVEHKCFEKCQSRIELRELFAAAYT